jgi:sec-independent protein translocase protein TatC
MSRDLSQMPLIDHLAELRTRLLITAGLFGLAVVVSFAIADRLYDFLLSPLADQMAATGQPDPRIIFTGVAEGFFAYLKIAFFTGACIGLPFLIYQIWAFISPGLHTHERPIGLLVLVTAPILFFAGGSMAYAGILPLALDFFLSFQNLSPEAGLPIELEARISEYLSFVTHLIFAFGCAFQLPLIMILGVRSGLFSADQLAAMRKYIFLIVLLFSALITPPDIVSQLFLAGPIFVLYELALFIARRLS